MAVEQTQNGRRSGVVVMVDKEQDFLAGAESLQWE